MATEKHIPIEHASEQYARFDRDMGLRNIAVAGMIGEVLRDG